MATTIIEIPVETSLKDKATEVFDKIGLDIPTAFRMFLTRSVYENGLPFGVTIPRPRKDSGAMMLTLRALQREAKRNGTAEMTLEEIDAEIEAVRKERAERGIPFSMTLPEKPYNGYEGLLALQQLSEEAKRNGTVNMTLEEIDAEIEAVRAERAERRAREAAE